jgi:NAD(P)-dependent dehydrogenase (short-subunit alcohol dehydrogenase family)
MAKTSILIFGGSRGCGLYTALNAVENGHHVTLLLRNPDSFIEEGHLKDGIEKNLVTLVKGNALVTEDLDSAFKSALSFGTIGLIVSSIGIYIDHLTGKIHL